MHKIAVAGKGGSGKTTIAGTLARILARRGHRVWAIDADSSPNLALTLGVAADRAADLAPMPRTLLEERTAEDGTRRMALAVPPADVAERYGVATPDGVTLLLMGRVDHAGAG
jgi:CO dehydrogenase maturation factor